MMHVTGDGKRMYVTNSLLSTLDRDNKFWVKLVRIDEKGRASNRLHRPRRSPMMYIWITDSGGMHGGRMHGFVHDDNAG
jgi:hypothetical protein